jgi:hypothetical protein
MGGVNAAGLHVSGPAMSHGRAAELVTELKELAKRGRVHPPTLPRSGQDIAADQIPVFGELLVVLVTDLDKAGRKIGLLTWVITVLTAVLVIDALVRWFFH